MRSKSLILSLIPLAMLVVQKHAISASYSKLPNISMYEDGRSCPNGCDSHVVLSNSGGFNGSIYAFSPPLSSRFSDRKACSSGGQASSKCIVCFEKADDSCIEVSFRGAGPHPWTFDFTPAFYKEWCENPSAPRRLRAQCADWQRKANRYQWNINCIANSNIDACINIMETANADLKNDFPYYQECLNDERKFNEKYRKLGRSDALRIHKCTYYENQLVNNDRGLGWHRLTPASCVAGTFVGTYGTDCCSQELFNVVAFGWPECKKYYPGGFVQPIQEQLLRLGYRVKPDGIYGSTTRSAIQKFQHSVKVTEDGEPSPELLDLLRDSSVKITTIR